MANRLDELRGAWSMSKKGTCHNVCAVWEGGKEGLGDLTSHGLCPRGAYRDTSRDRKSRPAKLRTRLLNIANTW